MKLSQNQFNVYSALKGKDSGQTISFPELIKKITTENPVVNLAREHGKGSIEYDELKVNNLECFYPNFWNSNNLRSPKYNYGTGYVYLDFDFKSKIEAINYREQLIKSYPFISASWLSLSELGLGVLIKVDNGGKFYFDQYWTKLNELIKGVDPATKNYNRLCVISHDPTVYVNEDCVSLDAVYQFTPNSIHYTTPLPDNEFININTPVIHVDGKDVLTVNLFKYKKNKIENGYRNKIIGRIGSMLIHLNPHADHQQLLSALMTINKNYCKIPLSEKEVINSLKANIKKFNNHELDVTAYLVKKFIFWHPLCKLNRNERVSVGRQKLSELKFIQREQLVLETIEVLKDQNLPINAISIMEYTHLKKHTFYEIIKKSKKVSSEWCFFRLKQYNPIGNNMSRTEKVSFDDTFLNNVKEPNIMTTHEKIYEALEDLQDGLKITQKRVSDYTGLSLITIKRNWLEAFKDLVKGYNYALKTIDPTPSIEVYDHNNYTDTYSRNLLNPLTNDDVFEKFIVDLKRLKVYQNYQETIVDC